MPTFNFEIGVAPYANNISDAQTDIQVSAVVVGTANSWYAEKIVFNQDTLVNRLGITLGPRPSGTPSYFVGITTSLGPYGQYPYTSDNIAGSAGSLGFSTFVITSSNTQLERIIELPISPNFTFTKNVPYFLCIQTITRNTGNFNFWGSSGQSALNRQNMAPYYTTGTGLSIWTSTVPRNIVVAGYDSGSGSTVWYPQGHYVTDDSWISATATGITHRYTAFFEFGARFELNEINVPDLSLRYAKFANIFPIDSDDQYTCKLYDHRYDVVGIAITEKAIFASSTVSDRGTFTFYFVPPVKIQSDFAYYLGISASGGTATSATHRVFTRTGGDTMRTQSTHYIDYIQRTNSGVAFTQSFTATGASQKYIPSIFLGLSCSSSFRRNIGN